MKRDLIKLSTKLEKFKEVVKSESQTKSVLVEPFIHVLGYDISNPFEVVTDYNCTPESKRAFSIEYALFSQTDRLTALVKTLNITSKLDEQAKRYLTRCFKSAQPEMAILTNGIEYQFYTDMQKEGFMDADPFFSFNILFLQFNDIESVQDLHKSQSQEEPIRKRIMKETVKETLEGFLYKQSVEPDDDLVSYITGRLNLPPLSKLQVATTLKMAFAPFKKLEPKEQEVPKQD